MYKTGCRGLTFFELFIYKKFFFAPRLWYNAIDKGNEKLVLYTYLYAGALSLKYYVLFENVVTDIYTYVYPLPKIVAPFCGA